MHKDEQWDMAWTRSLLNMHESQTQVTEVVQRRGHALGPAGLTELIRLKVLYASEVRGPTTCGKRCKKACKKKL